MFLGAKKDISASDEKAGVKESRLSGETMKTEM